MPDQIRSMFQEILQGYQSYAEAQGYTDPDKFDEYLLEYLGTSEAQSILSKWGSEIFKISGDISITSDQIAKLAEELGNGYQTYAAANGLADPSKMGEHFMAYLGTDGAQNQLTEAMLSMVDADRLEQQISGSLEAYMQQAMASYGGTVAQSLQTQIGSAMEQIMAQISTGMTDAMSQAAARIGTNIQNALTIDADAFANAFTMNMSGQEFAELMMSMSSAESASYEGNLRDLGYVDFNVPSQIDIYPKDFESKEQVVQILDDYNQKMEKAGKEEQVITYTDNGRNINVFRYQYHRYHQLCADRICGNLADRLVDHDRSHHIYQRAGAEKGKSESCARSGHPKEMCLRYLMRRHLSSDCAPE